MNMNGNRLAIIPARDGSKRIPKKNFRDFCGKPMLSYILGTAIASKLFDVVHVSTDSKDFADQARNLGAEVSFLRPSSLAEDDTPIVPVLKFVLNEFVARNQIFTSVAVLNACAPLLSVSDLRGAASLFDEENGKYDVLGVTEFPCPIEWAFNCKSNNRLKPQNPGMFAKRSQDILPSYYDAGQFCFMNLSRIMSSEGAGVDTEFKGYKLDRTRAIDIDTLEDWKHAELIYRAMAK